MKQTISLLLSLLLLLGCFTAVFAEELPESETASVTDTTEIQSTDPETAPVETASQEAALTPAVVHFLCPAGSSVTVRDAFGQAVAPTSAEDGFCFLLTPGIYTYSVFCEGYWPEQNVVFSVDFGSAVLEIRVELISVVYVEETEAAEETAPTEQASIPEETTAETTEGTTAAEEAAVLYCEAPVLSLAEFPEIHQERYANHVIYWDAVPGVFRYCVYVRYDPDGQWQLMMDNMEYNILGVVDSDPNEAGTVGPQYVAITVCCADENGQPISEFDPIGVAFECYMGS